jgi:DNA repair protein RadC
MFGADDLPLFSGTAPRVELDPYVAQPALGLEQRRLPTGCGTCLGTGRVKTSARRGDLGKRCPCGAGPAPEPPTEPPSRDAGTLPPPYRALSEPGPADPRPLIRDAADAVHVAGPALRGLEQEEMHVLLLDVRRRLLAEPVRLYRGTLDQITVRMAEVFRDAIRLGAASLILLNNHPSGDTSPSMADLRLTREAVQAGRLLDVEVDDHIVVGRGYTSLRASGVAWA